MDDDDERALTHDVWTNYPYWMTEFEQRVGRALLGRTKAAGATSPKMAEILLRRWGCVGDPEIETALAEGAEAFRRRVRDRLLTEHRSEIFVNRCPRCGRVVRTPLARQCFACGFDGH